MPIDEEAWEDAGPAYSHLESIQQVLLDNPNKAYTADELTEEVSDNSSSGSGFGTIIVLDVLVKLGEVEKRIADEQVYYRTVNQ